MTLAEDRHHRGPRFESIEAFLDWVERQPGRYELVGSEARAMAGGSANHARIGRNALTALAARLAHHRCEAFGSDLAVFLGPLRTVFPDVIVSCEPVTGRGIEHPVVIVEVLSRPRPSPTTWARRPRPTAACPRSGTWS